MFPEKQEVNVLWRKVNPWVELFFIDLGRIVKQGSRVKKNSYLVKKSEHQVSVFWENNMTAEEVGMAI